METFLRCNNQNRHIKKLYQLIGLKQSSQFKIKTKKK